jgi:hypothetical protein
MGKYILMCALTIASGALCSCAKMGTSTTTVTVGGHRLEIVETVPESVDYLTAVWWRREEDMNTVANRLL